LPQERRHRPGWQLRPDPDVRGVRIARAEGAIPAGSSGWPQGGLAGHERTRCRVRRNRVENQRALDGDSYVINGSKVFSTHSPDAELFLIYVRFGPGVGGIGSVLVERGTPGFQVGEPSSFMNGEQWSQLYFDDCRIPVENVLLGPGGFKKQISGFNVERLGNSSRALALGRHAFNVAREHAMTRKQFGRELCEFQGIQWKFADMAMKLEQAQMMLYRAALEGEHGLPSAQSTAMAKLACNMAGWEVSNEACR
jgi:alkylation response protein AidB-like acyl-CoA dehydrogenase